MFIYYFACFYFACLARDWPVVKAFPGENNCFEIDTKTVFEGDFLIFCGMRLCSAGRRARAGLLPGPLSRIDSGSLNGEHRGSATASTVRFESTGTGSLHQALMLIARSTVRRAHSSGPAP